LCSCVLTTSNKDDDDDDDDDDAIIDETEFMMSYLRYVLVFLMLSIVCRIYYNIKPSVT